MHLRKMVNTFYKDHPEKATATSLLLDFTLPIARPTVKPTELLKQKQRQLTKRRTTKRIKWDNKKGIQVSAVFRSQKPVAGDLFP